MDVEPAPGRASTDWYRTTHNLGTTAPARGQTHDIRHGPHGSNGKTLESAGTGDRTRSVHQLSLGTRDRAWRGSLPAEGQPRGKTNRYCCR